MRTSFSTGIVAVLLLSASSASEAAPARLDLAPVVREARLAEDLAAPRGTPLRYADVRALDARMVNGVSSMGTWTDARDATGAAVRLFQLQVRTPDAVSQDFGFSELFLPQGARLTVLDAGGAVAAGPYSAADVVANRRFQTALVAGDLATLRFESPPELERFVAFRLDRVAPAHRDIFQVEPGSLAKSGSCNVDVACPQGAPYPNQINSVASYTFSGFVCTGALINNSGSNRSQYFLTANHCVETQAEASSMVFYWKYESPTCRAVNSGASGTPIARNGNSIPQTGGADLRATRSASDFTLVQLRTAVPPGANAYLAGWDRRNFAPLSAFTIHHPQGDEKRISFDNEPLQIFDQPAPGLSFGNSFLRVVDYELGTTEGGSSGAPLFSPERRIVGQLAGGAALCTVPNGDDYFGRLATSFSGGTSTDARLAEWLDPSGSGVQTVDGAALACTPPVATLTAPAVARAGDLVDLTLTLPTGTYRVEWDIDGDGVIDRTEPSVNGVRRLQPKYPTAGGNTVSVRVSDASGCSGTVQRAIAVDGPNVSVAIAGSAQQLCGDNDGVVEPGERWRVPVTLRNDGAKAISDGHAVFGPLDANTLLVETPAVALPGLAAGGGTAAGTVDFAVPQNAACGAAASIRYAGALDRSAWSMQNQREAIGYLLGGGGACNVITTCPSPVLSFAPKAGLYVTPSRDGNGIGTVITDNPDAEPPVLFGAWFTGERSRLPIWYTTQGSLIGSQSVVVIRRFRRTQQFPFTVEGAVIGSGEISWLDGTNYLFTYIVNGVRGAERHQLGVTDTSLVPDRTGIWINQGEAGSGYFVDDHRNSGTPIEIVIAFIYGTDNEARWTFGGAPPGLAGGIPEDTFETHCPTCPTLADFSTTRSFAGTITPSYSSRTTGTLSTNLVTASPVGIEWVRSDLPIDLISTPRP